jgi:drug/metabolite transporter (DMT)-like permease
VGQVFQPDESSVRLESLTYQEWPMNPPAGKSELTLQQGRLFILAAAVLWSTNGFFTKVLTRPFWLGVHEPPIQPLQIAFFRLLFAGLFLVPTLRRGDLSFRPAMVGMGLCFASMNAMFISALALGTAANAILLQYTAPLWVYLVCVFFLGEPTDRRSTLALLFGLVGIGVIMAGGWEAERPEILLLGLGSGVTFAGILLFLRLLRAQSSNWLTVWNHLLGALLLAPFGLIADFKTMELMVPSGPQLLVLFVFGAFQMGFPYYLMARGLRVVSPQEAGAITLLEPMLNPVWAYLVSPETETPSFFTLVGGGLILIGLVGRYWPRRQTTSLPESVPPVGENR